MIDMGDILAIGAHADDIEIGAGGTIARLVLEGMRVSICILTDEADKDIAISRRNEAVKAAHELGVISDRVFFCGMLDGQLVADSNTVGAVRQILSNANINPALVITHATNDSHNDHRAAAQITLSAFRKTSILHYSIPNSSIVSDFSPRIFVDITKYGGKKNSALLAHTSQDSAGRILWEIIERAEHEYGQRIEADIAEAYELTIQQGGHRGQEIVKYLNDCPFHQFWFSLIKNDPIINIHAVPVARRHKEYDWPIDKDREGMAYLRRAFTKFWYGPPPIDEFSCGTEGVDRFLYNSNILLSGGAVSNGITRNQFNHFPGLRYTIDYDMPDYRNIRIRDSRSGQPITSEYMDDEFGNKIPCVDKGILTVMQNPMAEGKHIIGCMGIHGFGSLGCYKALAERGILREILAAQQKINQLGFQVIVLYDVGLRRAKIDWSTLHEITTINLTKNLEGSNE